MTTCASRIYSSHAPVSCVGAEPTTRVITNLTRWRWMLESSLVAMTANDTRRLLSQLTSQAPGELYRLKHHLVSFVITTTIRVSPCPVLLF